MAGTLVLEPEPGVAEDWLTRDVEGWPVVPPTTLTLHRTSPGDEQSRQVVVSLDGKRVAELLYGDTLTLEIAPGRHELRAHNTLMWRRVAFEALPGGHVHFTMVNRAPIGFYALLIVIGVAPLLLDLERGAPSSADEPSCRRFALSVRRGPDPVATGWHSRQNRLGPGDVLTGWGRGPPAAVPQVLPVIRARPVGRAPEIA